jgi:lipid kinase YegS
MSSNPPSICVIEHGEREADAALASAVAALRERGAEVTERPTREAGQGVKLAREAAERGVDIVLAAGGDGLLNEVVCGLTDAEAQRTVAPPSLGIVPMGTANDFAASLGVPQDPVEAAVLVLYQEPARIDVGLINGQAFLNMATGGFGAQVTRSTPAGLKRMLGGAAYTLTGLSSVGSMEAIPARFAADGFDWEGAFLVFAVGNGRQSGGAHVLCPEAMLDDGLLDVTIIPSPTEENAQAMLEALLSGGLSALPEAAVRGQVRDLTITSDQALHVNRDGEAMTANRLTFTIRPRSLRLHMPAPTAMLAAAPGPV